MKRAVLVALVILVALPLAAAEYEKLLLPVAPSIVICDKHSKYDTRLVAFNGNKHAVERICSDGELCRGLAARTGTVIAGRPERVPQPAFMYIPKEDAANMQLSLMVESSDSMKPEERSYTELPIVRESDFRSDTINIVGVRMDKDFRKTLRIFGLDGSTPIAVRVRVFSLGWSWPAYEHVYWLLPQAGQNDEGLDLAPTFNMECDLSAYVGNYDDPVRVELEPLTEGAKIWGFVSVTNNATQHFYTVVPR